MSLALDARQRAMLGEMGVRVFAPLPGEQADAPAPSQGAAPRQALESEARAQPRSRVQPAAKLPPKSSGEIEQMDWDALGRAVAEGHACPSCSGQIAVFGSGDLQPDWLIVGDPPDENEERQGEPFAGQPGVLLDNMLKALGLDRRKKVYLTNVMKCRPPGNRNPDAVELAQCEPVLRRQIQLLQPRIILVMGRFAVPFLLGTSEPIGRLRGRAHEYLGVPVVATYHPAYLLRNLQDKAKAWGDLCLALELVQGLPSSR
jgi:uracil-DNA glycosylase